MIKLFYILIFTFGINFTSFAQIRPTASPLATPANLVKFYPNPASAVITFEFSKASDSQYAIQVFNFMGKKIYDLPKMPTRITINLEEFYRGIYIFQVRDRAGTIVQSGKFQVVK